MKKNEVPRSRTSLPAFIQVSLLLGTLMLGGCGTPTARVEVVPPDKPITINLNIKIDHEVRVKVEKELDAVLSKDSPLF